VDHSKKQGNQVVITNKSSISANEAFDNINNPSLGQIPKLLL
jgi:hypothetical protein